MFSFKSAFFKWRKHCLALIDVLEFFKLIFIAKQDLIVSLPPPPAPPPKKKIMMDFFPLLVKLFFFSPAVFALGLFTPLCLSLCVCGVGGPALFATRI